MRVFICADRRFPRGDAGANLILHQALALQDQGAKVLVISVGATPEGDRQPDGGSVSEGVSYDNVTIGKGWRKPIDHYLLSGPRTVDKLREYGLTPTDRVIVYTSNAIYGVFVQGYSRRCGARVSMEVVEWFQPEQFGVALLNPKYWLYLYCFHALYPRTKSVLAISGLLKDHFQALGCQVLQVPVLTDTSPRRAPERRHGDKIRLIYSGNPRQKEAFSAMLEAFRYLEPKERSRLEFHVTGCGRTALMAIPGVDKDLLLAVQDNLVIHPWMEYKELSRLYESMDFLYLIRRSTKANVANFPSKVPELLAYGVAPLANRVGDFHESLRDGHDCLLVDGSDTKACVSALRRALQTSPEERFRLAQGAQLTAQRVFDYRGWGAKLAKFVLAEERVESRGS